MENLHIVADENIPGLDAYTTVFGSIQRVAAAHINRVLLEQADILLVRSVTRIDRSLLEGTNVRFVGSATAGIDHVDVDYLARAGIHFAHAAGSNAVSVVEYCIAALFVLATRMGRNVTGMTAGIVGCGHVGERLALRLEAMGMKVLRNDPPRALIDPDRYVSLETILNEADLISIHTPLTFDGPHPTYHLLGESEFGSMKRGAWLINAARGPIVNGTALKKALKSGALAAAALDVWEEEPEIDPDLVDLVAIATPHIAGYSYDAKLNGRKQIMDTLFHFLDAEAVHPVVDEEEPVTLRIADPSLPFSEMMRYYIDQMYDIVADDARLRTAISKRDSVSESFTKLRREYPRRYTFSRYRLPFARPEVYEGLRVGRSEIHVL